MNNNCNNNFLNNLDNSNNNRICFPRVCFGPTGPTGATPTLTIGTVTTGDPGTEASATITGTAPDFVLDLTIPQGPTGPAA